MRLAGELKMGYYPTSEEVIENCYRALDIDWSDNEPILIDPCCGTGEVGSSFSRCKKLGVELDMGRAILAERRMSKVLCSDAFLTQYSPEMASVLFLNPPYNQVKGGKRLEYMFLKEYTQALQPGGVLIFIIQKCYLQGHIAKTLASNYQNFQVRGYPETQFDQLILFGKKRKTPIQPDQNIVLELQNCARSADLPLLKRFEDFPDYQVPPRPEKYHNVDGETTFTWKARSFDFEKALKEVDASNANASLERFLFVRTNDKIAVSPPMPFKAGHSALLAVSGYLDGVVGSGNHRHVVKARAVKSQKTAIETNDNGQTEKVIRDHFQIEAKVLLPDGTIKVLSRKEDEKEQNADSISA